MNLSAIHRISDAKSKILLGTAVSENILKKTKAPEDFPREIVPIYKYNIYLFTYNKGS